MTAHMDFTHPVLSLLAFEPARLKYSQDYQCSMSREIHHLQLKFASFLCFFFFLISGWTFGKSNSNKSFHICWISETRRLVSNLRLWSPILSPQIRQSEAKCWKWISINTLKDWYLDRKKGKGSYYSIMVEKSNNNGSAISARNPGVEHVFWTSELKDCLPKF